MRAAADSAEKSKDCVPVIGQSIPVAAAGVIMPYSGFLSRREKVKSIQSESAISLVGHVNGMGNHDKNSTEATAKGEGLEELDPVQFTVLLSPPGAAR